MAYFIFWLVFSIIAIWIPFRAMAKGPEKKSKNQSEDDRYEDDSLREDKAYLERMDEHIRNNF